MTATPWIKEVAQRVAGQGAGEDKMWRLWRFVQSRIGRADRPSSAEAVLEEGRGQRLPLLLTLMGAAGLEVAPVALHAPALGPPLDIPSVHHFSLLGARVSHGGGESLLFGDGSYGVPDALPPSATGGEVLDLAIDRPPERSLFSLFGATSSRLSNLPSEVVVEDAPSRMALDLKVEGDRLSGFLALQIPKHQAEPLRDVFLAADESQLKAAFEQMLGASLPGVAVTALEAPALNRRGEALGMGVTLQVPIAAASGQPVRLDKLFADGATTPLGLFPGTARLLQVAERRRPIDVPAGHEVLELQISLPAGATFTEVPEPVSLSAGSIDLEARTEVTDQRLYWRREMKIEPERIDVDEWRRVRPALVTLANAAQARLSFLLADGPGPLGSSDPDDVAAGGVMAAEGRP